MAPFSTSTVATELPKEVVKLLMETMDKASHEAARMLWSALLTFLGEHWIGVMVASFFILVFATLNAAIGRWGMLGSVLYNALYFGILFIVGLIFGPDVFVSDVFHAACTVILYPICYGVTGIILEKTGAKHWGRRM